MKGNKYKPKVIKRYDHTGVMVNYGMLEVGIVAGIRCLANKETLLLIGAGLAKQKVPDYFYTQHYVRIPLPNNVELKVYAIKATDVSCLTGRISARGQVKKAELINTRYGRPDEKWDEGNKVSSTSTAPEVRMEQVQFKRKPKRIGKIRRLWLLVKRLFSSPGIES